MLLLIMSLLIITVLIMTVLIMTLLIMTLLIMLLLIMSLPKTYCKLEPPIINKNRLKAAIADEMAEETDKMSLQLMS